MPKIIGLLGGVASGKSLVAARFAELGAGLLDADRAAHEVLELDDVKRQLRARWGDQIVGPDGALVRASIGRLVFGDDPRALAERKFLEQVTHPRIGELLGRQAQAHSEAGAAVLVLDAPLMLEAGWRDFCHKTVFVDAPREVRLDRAQKRGWSAAEFAAREAAQASLDAKRQSADLIVDNSGSVAATRAQVDRIWGELCD